jgi:serine/threonine protein kinase
MTTVFNQIGPYQIIKQIGQGGMATVFLARDTRTGQQVALKLVPQGTDREARAVLEAERFGAELQRQFSQVSTHVPAVYEYGIDDESGYFYVSMEYLDGGNLSDVLTPGPLPVERAVHIAVELCRFLEDAHRFELVIDGRNLRSLLHLDLKPRNVRITSTEQVKVLDFGIAKALSLSRKVTRNDFGSVAYLSPERLETGEVDARADFWAIGVLLYEMVCGIPPFQAPDTRRLEQQILSRRPPPAFTGACPAGVQAIVAKLLAPDPTARYDSARAIRDDLERVMSGSATNAEQEGWTIRAADDEATRRTRRAVDAAPATASSPHADEEKTRRTRPPAIPPIPPLPDAVRDVAPPTVKDVAAAKRGDKTIKGQPRRSRSRSLFRAALLLIAIGIVGKEIGVAMDASRAAGTVRLRELDQLEDAWAEYDALSRRSSLNIGTMSLEHALVERTSALADRVIANYRTPSPTVRETQWQLARDALARAVAATGDHDELRAALRYCEGHLHRINGEAHKTRNETTAAGRELTEAVVAFREAAELRPGWPDPFLGLARTFTYGLEDVDRGADALSQAEKNGHTPSDREIAQLADGYRLRGNSLVRSATQLSGLPQERDYLTRAADAYRQALAYYATVTSFAHTPANIRLAQRGLNQAEERLSILTPATPDPPSQIESGGGPPDLHFGSPAPLEEAVP